MIVLMCSGILCEANKLKTIWTLDFSWLINSRLPSLRKVFNARAVRVVIVCHSQ